MTLLLIFSSAGILIFISLIHVHCAFGGRWGTSATFPVREDEASTEIVPPTLITLIAAFFSAFFYHSIGSKRAFTFLSSRYIDKMGICTHCIDIYFTDNR
jgi:hypothetical protein